jgi:hypothetical protein
MFGVSSSAPLVIGRRREVHFFPILTTLLSAQIGIRGFQGKFEVGSRLKRAVKESC